MSIKGKINSIQTLGTVDGPGVRFVAFVQGCNLRCGCCHNPDTWDLSSGTEYTPLELAEKAEKFKEYFGKDGGVTLSGGEPLLQSEFSAEFFIECHKKGIHTCLDTSGSVLGENVEKLLENTDLVLLDFKYTNDEDYKKYVGCSMEKPIEFLSALNKKNIPTILRQVIIPDLNGTEDNIEKLNEIAKKYPCVQKIELLPFKKICQVKYDKMNITFPFADLRVPNAEEMENLKKMCVF